MGEGYKTTLKPKKKGIGKQVFLFQKRLNELAMFNVLGEKEITVDEVIDKFSKREETDRI